jgi:hypothetical protein
MSVTATTQHRPRSVTQLRRREWARPSCRRSLGLRLPKAEAEVAGKGAPRLEPVKGLQTRAILCNPPTNNVRFTLNQYRSILLLSTTVVLTFPCHWPGLEI